MLVTMERSKLEFSPQQLSLLHDASVWNAKRELIDGVSAWMGNTLERLKQHHQVVFGSLVPAPALNGKITRGENYNGFPYVLLDYPNLFSKEEIVAARNLVWFGNGFHCTLHIKGTTTTKALSRLHASPNILICVADNEWIHHINERDWISCNALDEKSKKRINAQGWMKLGIEIPFAKPESWTNDLMAVYETWRAILQP